VPFILAKSAGAQSIRAVTQAPCAGTTVQANLFASRPAAWFENLGFDGSGGMWIAEIGPNQIVRFNSAGASGARVAAPYPGGIARGSDGLIYADYGDEPVSGGLQLGQAGVVLFDPQATAPAASNFVSGLQMANGAAFDSAGNLYVSDTANGLITRIRPDGSIDTGWSNAASLPSANGLAVSGRYLYATVTDDSDSSIYRIPLADPAARTRVAQLGVGGGAAPKILDDLAVGADGRLYVTSGTGELLRVNPSTGAACLLYSGPPLTSARFAFHFAPFDPRTDLFVTSELGEVIHLHLISSRVG